MSSRFAALAAWLSLPLSGQADPAPRRVFALHSGVHIFFAHPDKNYAALHLRKELLRRGVAERDIVVLDCPYPEATWKNLVPRDGVVMFLESMSASSKVSKDAYRRMHQAFQAQGVGPRDEIVWIGHSAGGQMGLTLAQLSAEMAKHPDLAKDAKPYRFRTIITLGTPIGNNKAPDDVRVRNYFSPQDKILRIVCDGGPWLLPSWGYNKLTIFPCTPAPGKNCLTRCWYDMEHPDWIHEQRVLDRVLEDAAGQTPSPWRTPRPADRPGAALVQLLGRMLEEEHRVCIEDLPK